MGPLLNLTILGGCDGYTINIRADINVVPILTIMDISESPTIIYSGQLVCLPDSPLPDHFTNNM